MAEMIDVLDENGVKTGAIATRSEVHKKSLWHRAIVVAVITEKNELSKNDNFVDRKEIIDVLSEYIFRI